MHTGGGIDTLDPEGAKLTLANTAVAIGILTGLVHCLLGNAEHILAATVITLGSTDYLGVTGPGGCPGSDSCHDKSPLGVRQEAFDDACIRVTKDHGATRLALHFLGPTTEIVLQEGGVAANLATGGKAKAFFRPALGFQFGHFNLFFSLVGGVITLKVGRACPVAPGLDE